MSFVWVGEKLGVCRFDVFWLSVFVCEGIVIVKIEVIICLFVSGWVDINI